MKWILLFACALLFTSGCFSSREEWRGHVNNARFGGITAGLPAVEVRAPAGQAGPQEVTGR